MRINLTVNEERRRLIDKFVCFTYEIGNDMNDGIAPPGPGVYHFKAQDNIPTWVIKGDGLAKFGLDAVVNVYSDGTVITTFPSAGNAIEFTR